MNTIAGSSRMGDLSRRILQALSIASFLGVACGGSVSAQPARQQPAAARITDTGAKDTIPGQYIVVFKRGASRAAVAAAEDRAKALGATIGFTYMSALIGFSVKLPKDPAQAQRALQALREAPDVDYIAADQKVHGATVQPPNPAGAPPTGLDRIDRRLLPLNNSYTYSETGAGVHAYVIDSGIRMTHAEFGGRASGASFTAITTDGFGAGDCFGHGTHVAATIGGATYGVAKAVNLHSVRVLDCSNSGTWSGVIAGVNWVTANATLPAVANMSLSGGVFAPVDTAVTNSIASGVTYVVSASNNGADACGFSPAHIPAAITVSATDPLNDTRPSWANFGSCVDIFAPGVNILSAWNTSDTATNTISGTSQAAPHVTGAVARHLQNAPDLPAAVWNLIDNDADLFGTTLNWPGVINPGPGTPNKLLHFGSLNDGYDDGDPHFTTVDGVHFDFQSAGEFVTLRDGNGMQIQTRHTGVTAAPAVANPYTGLTSCVSINTAVAARVGTHRVTYEPSGAGASGMQLRVDGTPATLGAQGITLGAGGRVTNSTAANGIDVEFPNGTSLTVIPNFWPSQNIWYLSVSIFRTPASEGIMGAIAPGSWLPALPNGSSLGPKPASLHQRYVDLHQTFANAWRVTNATSLFDYAPGASTATYTFAAWPPENPPCVFPKSPPVKPLDRDTAQKLCHEVADKQRNANCVFDVAVTGEAGFVKPYLVSQRLEAGATRTFVSDDKDTSQLGAPVTFTATVAHRASSGRAVPAGAVQFTVDGSRAGDPVKLDSHGRAAWQTSRLSAGKHQVSARYVPSEGSVFLASTSLDRIHAVLRAMPPTQ